jgi:hypothetical protein
MLQALKRRGIDFSFLAPTHLACQDAISRVGRAFVSAQVRFYSSTCSLQSASVSREDSGSVCFIWAQQHAETEMLKVAGF